MTDLRPLFGMLFLIYVPMVVIYVVFRLVWKMAGTGRRFLLLIIPAFLLENLVSAWQHPSTDPLLWLLHVGAFAAMAFTFWRVAHKLFSPRPRRLRGSSESTRRPRVHVFGT